MSFKLDVNRFSTAVTELIRKVATELPADVVQAMETARDNEEKGSPANSVLSYMLKNVNVAKG